jgi:hypothetical protein
VNLADARGRAWARDHGMLAEQKSRVFDEHRVRVVTKLGQADDLKSGVGERVLIAGVLFRGFRGIDRNAFEVS